MFILQIIHDDVWLSLFLNYILSINCQLPLTFWPNQGFFFNRDLYFFRVMIAANFLCCFCSLTFWINLLIRYWVGVYFDSSVSRRMMNLFLMFISHFTWYLYLLITFDWIFSMFGNDLRYLTFKDIDQNMLILLFINIAHIFLTMLFSCRISIVFDMLLISTPIILYRKRYTLNFLLFFIEDIHILFKSFFSFFSFRIIFLKILTKVYQMNLDL